jgi:carbon starvation protein
VVQELAVTFRIKPLENKYLATGFAVTLALLLALMRGPGQTDHGTGGFILWPLFGATNQLLAGLAFMVTAFYLLRRNKPVWFIVVPMILMIVMPAWAMSWQMFNAETGWARNGQYLLAGVGGVTMLLQAWMVVEAALVWPRVRGVLEEALPPLVPRVGAQADGRSC